MPFSPGASASTATPTLDPKRRANNLVFAIGVSKYDHFPDRSVGSATANALAWLVMAVHAGVALEGNTLAVAEGPSLNLQERMKAGILASDLPQDEAAGLLALGFANDKSAGRLGSVVTPTFSNILGSLVFQGNHLEWKAKGVKVPSRLLLTYSGHGALVRGCPAMCPSDTEPGGACPSEQDQKKRLDGLVGKLKAKRSAPFDQAAALVEAMWDMALKKRVTEELLDVLDVPVDSMLKGGYRPEVMVALLDFISRNLKRVPKQSAGVPELRKVITPVHLMLTLGEHDRLVTFVLDSCNSGGLGSGLQGSMEGHSWIRAGLNCRIISASEGAELAAEARIGERRLGAATWALTQVLSRWSPVEDGPAYALNIRNGDLIQRANVLLSALSFRQQLSLHAPDKEKGAPSVSSMPFCGFQASTQTVSDPDEAAGGIQISSDVPALTTWEVLKSGARKALLLAVKDNTSTFSYNGANYVANKLYVFTTASKFDELVSSGFEVRMTTWDRQGTVPTPIADALATFNNSAVCSMPAANDPDEHSYVGPSNPSGVYRYQRSSSTKEVFFRWLAAAGSEPRKLVILTRAGFPFTPSEFNDNSPSISAFVGCSNPGFNSDSSENNPSKERVIGLPSLPA